MELQNAKNIKVVDVIRNEFERRCKKNPSYSLRAFAKSLEFSPQRLSHVLNGKRGLSMEAGTDLAKKLSLSEREASIFLDMIESEFGRSLTSKLAAKKRMKKKSYFSNVGLDTFKLIADWYHFAILTMLELKTAYFSENEIASDLGISKSQAKFALERLLRLGMVDREEDGQLTSLGKIFIDTNNIPNEAVKSFHEQVLDRTKLAIREVGIDERDFSTLFVAIDPDQFKEAQTFIKDFREEFDRRFSRNVKNKQQVYTLGIQFYKTSKKVGA